MPRCKAHGPKEPCSSQCTPQVDTEESWNDPSARELYLAHNASDSEDSYIYPRFEGFDKNGIPTMYMLEKRKGEQNKMMKKAR